MYADRLREALNRMSNEVYDTLELRRYFASPLTRPGSEVRNAMMRHYFVPTNRDCWAYVMGGAPIDVKQVIWKHEQDELIFDPRLGAAHVAADGDRPDRERPDAVVPEGIEPPSGVVVAMFARRQFAKDSHWLPGIAASHIMERMNDPTVVKDGALVQRGVRQLREDLHVPEEQLPANARVHQDADVEHAGMLWGVFERHVRGEDTYRQAMYGAKFGLDCFRVYAGAVGDLMASVAPRG